MASIAIVVTLVMTGVLLGCGGPQQERISHIALSYAGVGQEAPAPVETEVIAGERVHARLGTTAEAKAETVKTGGDGVLDASLEHGDGAGAVMSAMDGDFWEGSSLSLIAAEVEESRLHQRYALAAGAMPWGVGSVSSSALTWVMLRSLRWQSWLAGPLIRRGVLAVSALFGLSLVGTHALRWGFRTEDEVLDHDGLLGAGDVFAMAPPIDRRLLYQDLNLRGRDDDEADDFEPPPRKAVPPVVDREDTSQSEQAAPTRAPSQGSVHGVGDIEQYMTRKIPPVVQDLFYDLYTMEGGELLRRLSQIKIYKKNALQLGVANIVSKDVLLAYGLEKYRDHPLWLHVYLDIILHNARGILEISDYYASPNSPFYTYVDLAQLMRKKNEIIHHFVVFVQKIQTEFIHEIPLGDELFTHVRRLLGAVEVQLRKDENAEPIDHRRYKQSVETLNMVEEKPHFQGHSTAVTALLHRIQALSESDFKQGILQLTTSRESSLLSYGDIHFSKSMVLLHGFGRYGRDEEEYGRFLQILVDKEPVQHSAQRDEMVEGLGVFLERLRHSSDSLLAEITVSVMERLLPDMEDTLYHMLPVTIKTRVLKNKGMKRRLKSFTEFESRQVLKFYQSLRSIPRRFGFIHSALGVQDPRLQGIGFSLELAERDYPRMHGRMLRSLTKYLKAGVNKGSVAEYLAAVALSLEELEKLYRSLKPEQVLERFARFAFADRDVSDYPYFDWQHVQAYEVFLATYRGTRDIKRHIYLSQFLKLDFAAPSLIKRLYSYGEGDRYGRLRSKILEVFYELMQKGTIEGKNLMVFAVFPTERPLAGLKRYYQKMPAAQKLRRMEHSEVFSDGFDADRYPYFHEEYLRMFEEKYLQDKDVSWHLYLSELLNLDVADFEYIAKTYKRDIDDLYGRKNKIKKRLLNFFATGSFVPTQSKELLPLHADEVLTLEELLEAYHSMEGEELLDRFQAVTDLSGFHASQMAEAVTEDRVREVVAEVLAFHEKKAHIVLSSMFKIDALELKALEQALDITHASMKGYRQRIRRALIKPFLTTEAFEEMVRARTPARFRRQALEPMIHNIMDVKELRALFLELEPEEMVQRFVQSHFFYREDSDSIDLSWIDKSFIVAMTDEILAEDWRRWRMFLSGYLVLDASKTTDMMAEFDITKIQVYSVKNRIKSRFLRYIERHGAIKRRL